MGYSRETNACQGNLTTNPQIILARWILKEYFDKDYFHKCVVTWDRVVKPW
jgi:hypothetical protein